MRILLTANASYAPPRGGATRSNLVWLDRLARAGHSCRVVSGGAGEGAEMRRHESIAILSVHDPARRIEALRREIREFAPDWVLVSSEDLGHGLLREASHSAEGRVVYLAHTPQFYPFGPAAWNPEPQAAALVSHAAGIVAIGRHMAAYIERAIGRAPAVIHPPLYGPGPFPVHACVDRGFLLMLNPCAVKGLPIFLEVAARLPSLAFAVVPGWGTTAEDRRAIQKHPNVRILPNPRSIDEVFAETRLLLMPSLWFEGFGLIVMEAMLRGIPVIASNSGGLEDAKCGTGYVIPVEPIRSFQQAYDEHAMPRPVLGPVDPHPWVHAIQELLSRRAAYEKESAASREAGARFVAGLDPDAFERYLQNLRPAAAEAPAHATVESLSPARRALLLDRLHRRKMVH